MKDFGQRYELKPTQKPAESHFKAPSSWVLPKVGESMKDVVMRLGPPHGDERTETQSKAKY